jgi:hypothetical protein
MFIIVKEAQRNSKKEGYVSPKDQRKMNKK